MVYSILKVYYIFIPRNSSIWTIKKMEKWSILAESNRNCRIIIFFFFIRNIYFLSTSNLFVIQTEYFLIKFWCPFFNAIIGFKKLLNFVSNWKAKTIIKISIFSPISQRPSWSGRVILKMDSGHKTKKIVFYLKSLRLFLRILCIENELYFAPDKLKKFMNIIIW